MMMAPCSDGARGGRRCVSPKTHGHKRAREPRGPVLHAGPFDEEDTNADPLNAFLGRKAAERPPRPVRSLVALQ